MEGHRDEDRQRDVETETDRQRNSTGKARDSSLLILHVCVCDFIVRLALLALADTHI